VRFFRRRKEESADAPSAADSNLEAVTFHEGDADLEAFDAEDQQRTEQALQRTRRSWFSGITGLFGGGQFDESLWEELEELLIGADAGVATTQRILDDVRAEVRALRTSDSADVREVLKQELVSVLQQPEGSGALWNANGTAAIPPRPAVILVLGVNGSGKTTTIAKLAHAYQRDGGKAVVAAGDTFRAAAIDQLKEWGERLGIDVIATKQGADPGAVVFDALSAAESRDADVVIIDTAGRLHTKFNLMEELAKIRRIIQRKDPEAPHETLLVLDATTGQNALTQAKAFTEKAEVTSICLTKLDGSSKGGVVFAIGEQLGIPVRFVGTGEGPDDIAPFSPEQFVDALFRD
jgi:fused signal recognition particle receptor